MLINMDDEASLELTHSRILFVDDGGNPMRFYMVPCQEKSAVKPLIERGGGILSSKLKADSIKLAPEGMDVKSDGYVSQSFITDSVRANILQDLDLYRVDPGSTVSTPLGSSMETSKIIVHAARDKKGRKKYLLCQDKAIIKYLLEDSHYTRMNGNAVWKDMERFQVTTHTWQSMKDHFRKKIVPHINNYRLRKLDVAKLTGTTTQSGGTKNPTPPQDVSGLSLPSPRITGDKPTTSAEDNIPADHDLDEFDLELFANVFDKSGPQEGSTCIDAQSKERTTNGTSDGASHMTGSKKPKHASAQNVNSCTVVLEWPLGVTGDGDHVIKTRRKHPLRFRTIDNDDDKRNESESERNVTSTTHEMKSCDGDVVMSCHLRGQGHLPDMASPRKQYTKTLRSQNEDVEKVDGSRSPRTPAEKKKSKEEQIGRLGNGHTSGETRATEKSREQDVAGKDVTKFTMSRLRTRASSRQVKVMSPENDPISDVKEQCGDLQQHLGLKRIANPPSDSPQRKKGKANMRGTADPKINGDVSSEGRKGAYSRSRETTEDPPHRQTRAASRLAAVSASEDEKDDEEDQHLDPRSYLSSKRGSSQTTSPPDGIEPVVSYVMSSDDSETVAEPAASDTNSEDRRQTLNMKQETQKKNYAVKIIDTVVQWLGIPVEDFIDVVLYCNNSVDDAIAFILTGRKPSGGSTGETR